MRPSPTPLLDWRRAISCLHRWLGIAGGALFLLWFASGIVMVYARMPALDPAERLRRLPDLDLAAARVAPGEAARDLGLAPERLRIAMLGDRPVYRFAERTTWVAVFADDGRPFGSLTAAAAARLARRLYPEHAATARHDRRLVAPDQWTLQSRSLLPAHRIALGDPEDTRVYISERTGEPVMSTTRRARRWAYAGPVPHWLYFTPLRSRGSLWNRAVIGLSLAGSVLAVSGLVSGVWQAIRARRSAAGAPLGSRIPSPYTGWMRWHHYAGLAFGLFTFTWVASGCLSMDPLAWHPGTEPTAVERDAVAGGPLRLDALTLDRLRAVHAALDGDLAVKELELVQLRSEPFLLAYRPPAATPPRRGIGYDPSAFLSIVQPFEPRLVSALDPERGTFSRFDEDEVMAAARAAMPHARLVESTWLDAHDSYYYPRGVAAPLPVLRARFDDPSRTWLYLDPGRGVLVRKEERLTRLNRWLYHGLHSLDFPFLRDRRPLRDAVVIALCLGGILVASTSMADGWRRVGRHLRRLAPRGR
ncbi:MAG TPA: PepSY domain-containing protein, partial [Thermoanaerobaculia bacterium]|nr:PepSY domain-containing protein [Thermoanaerobaculia bacterium]